MNDQESKGPSVTAEAVQKTDGFGKPHSPALPPGRRTLPPEKYRKLLRHCKTFAGTLRRDRDFAQAIHADPAGFRSDLERAIRGQFPMRRGRPMDPQVDAACRMVREGKSVPEVLRSQIPGWDSLDTYTRYLLAKGLRQAVARRGRG